MILDENAFGILISYFHVEDEEYGLERAGFVERFTRFRDLLRDAMREAPLGAHARAVDLGHAVYFEVAEDRHTTSPLGWARKVRQRLAEHEFDSAVFVTHGSRWIDEEAETFLSTEHLGDFGLVTLSNPSE